MSWMGSGKVFGGLDVVDGVGELVDLDALKEW